ncbi:MAG: putative 4-hydroxybenzoate polyprenyltransferase [Turneriella sp.]|nr:putative 4-hydroxybenzoate polyprenyltransferase [Turneriella sp.]
MRFWHSIAHFLRLIRFSHTLFALPFALSALAIVAVRYRDQVEINWQKAVLIVVAFTAMRSFAMAFNRYADRHWDALNPRTQNREIPAGVLSPRTVLLFAAISLAVLVVAAWLLSPLAGMLALPVAIFLAGYSYAKRFTAICHFWLGAAIGLAPLAVSVALLEQIIPESWLLALSLAFYIAGFDILYALQDAEFDRKHGLHSLPARAGIGAALWISRASHFLSLIFIGLLFYSLGAGARGTIAIAFLAVVLVLEHGLVGSAKSIRYDRIPLAFFHANSLFSLLFLAAVLMVLWA